jgi:hypothetical protein
MYWLMLTIVIRGPFLLASSLAQALFASGRRAELLKPSQKYTLFDSATVNQHPPMHHPLDGRYYSVVDEPQLS